MWRPSARFAISANHRGLLAQFNLSAFQTIINRAFRSRRCVLSERATFRCVPSASKSEVQAKLHSLSYNRWPPSFHPLWKFLPSSDHLTFLLQNQVPGKVFSTRFLLSGAARLRELALKCGAILSKFFFVFGSNLSLFCLFIFNFRRVFKLFAGQELVRNL